EKRMFLNFAKRPFRLSKRHLTSVDPADCRVRSTCGNPAPLHYGVNGPDRTLAEVLLGGTMKFRSIRCVIGIFLFVLLAVAGCGTPAADTGPAEEPNVGPGVPAGGPVPAAKGAAKADAKAAAKPESGGASTKDASKK